MADAETAQAGLNIPLIDRVLEQIDGYPETWFQSAYSNVCGSAFCVAGWVAVMGGFTYVTDRGSARWTAPDGTPSSTSMVALYARNELGLTTDQACALFYGDNTRSQIETVLDAIREGAL